MTASENGWDINIAFYLEYEPNTNLFSIVFRGFFREIFPVHIRRPVAVLQ